MSWLFNGQEFTSDDIADFVSFVYIITCIPTGRKYIGKKRFEFMRSKKRKDSKRRIRTYKESDWKEYYGSSSEVAKDIVKYGKEGFKREIIRLCKTKSEASYWELYEQMVNHVLLNEAEYYNNFVGTKIHRSHVNGKIER